ncbi:skin secretory protein xP2 [Iris pallida]|uniref:Skin secretory protein xP2 n=1 Tax=Iris pallida TaxID=29817 RepID=A0AAX6F4N6_IRIPA|nr:skin secretory protein xP2 [Iris pallida]
MAPGSNRHGDDRISSLAVARARRRGISSLWSSAACDVRSGARPGHARLERTDGSSVGRTYEILPRGI